MASRNETTSYAFPRDYIKINSYQDSVPLHTKTILEKGYIDKSQLIVERDHGSAAIMGFKT